MSDYSRSYGHALHSEWLELCDAGFAEPERDWAREHVPSLLEITLAAEHYRVCKHDQGDRQDTKCLHVKWNGGPQERSCVRLLFDALDALKGK